MVLADSAAFSAAQGRSLIAALKLRALGNLATVLYRTRLLTQQQLGLINQFSGDVGDDL